MPVQVSPGRVVQVATADVSSVVSGLFRPSRLTAAGRCLYCEVPGCRAVECVVTHAASSWGVCESCGGRCCENCVFGVVEVAPVEALMRAADVARLGPEGAATAATLRKLDRLRREVEELAMLAGAVAA